MRESELSHRAAEESLPLRDAFSVPFFVSVGMLFEPAILIERPLHVLGVVAVIIVGKSLAAAALVIAFRYPLNTVLTVAASLAQIGEFSFILAVLGVKLQIVPPEMRDLVVAGAILSILLNPLLFVLLERVIDRQPVSVTPVEAEAPPQRAEEQPTALSGHAVLVGYGRVGARIGEGLMAAKIPFLVVGENEASFGPLAERGIETYAGACGETALLARLNLPGARWLITAIPDAFEAGHIVEAARKANPSIRILSRAQGSDAAAYLKGLGADQVFIGEEELADGMLEALDAPQPA
jgi:CPA2 family monovalent cation:H+ antiporter-2